jgi:competence protein ComGC
MKKIIITSLLIALLIPNASAQAATKSLNTKGNKSSCKTIKANYKSEVIANWSNN